MTSGTNSEPGNRGEGGGLSFVLGVVGAVIGGYLGYILFLWIARQGFYALALPGALMGIGCGLLSRRHSFLLGALCGIAALALGVFTEWKYAPFVDDDSLLYFLKSITSLKPLTLGMIVLGGVFGFWFGVGGSRR